LTTTEKEIALSRVSDLVAKFRRNSADYHQNAYNETQARTDFITPLLEAFGWDVHNHKGFPSSLREVVEEATVEVGEERLSKKPDYELRLARQRKIFVEAKKPHVRIEHNKAPAFQVRRYGYSASLPISILTNFHQLAVYDCVPKPYDTDEAHTARILLLGYEDFEAKFDELWGLLSRESVYSGTFDQHFSIGATRHGAQQFDDYFLGQVRAWRERLAIDINVNTPGLTSAELAYAVQLFLSRIVFLRICEDRDIEKYETLKEIGVGSTFDALLAILKRADAFYDSGLFRLLDDERLGIRISDSTLQGIISELYYPHSPYTFAVVETEVLGEIYEQFLGEEIEVLDGKVTIILKPEVRESGGVVPTPRYVVDAIVERTVVPLISGKGPTELADFTVADPCCGSGIFLISAYERLLDHYLEFYIKDNTGTHTGKTIYEAGAGLWKLMFEEKRRILITHIRGVDIDPNAVEVARLSLFLKLIEDEVAVDLAAYVKQHQTPVLPPLDLNLRSGNSLVSTKEWRAACGKMPQDLSDKVRPFSWTDEFPADFATGGFNAIIENPPYVRIQNMTAYSPEEAAYYRKTESPYSTAHQDNFDKYTLFIERSLSLLKPFGKMGAIVPHKFMTIQGGRALRRLLITQQSVEEIVHFGVKQVFGPGTSNYTCLLVLNRAGTTGNVRFEKVESLEAWRYGQPGTISTIPRVEFSEEAWQFADGAAKDLFDRVRTNFPKTLGVVAEIFVGVQTSADDVYIVRAKSETDDTITVHWNGSDWLIERGILRPCLHDVTIQAYSRPTANSWMIFPYKLVRNNHGKTIAQLIQPKDFRRDFPNCFAYLEARSGELAGRSVTGGIATERQWYQYGRSQSLTKFDSPKIVLPILSLEARYAYDDANTMLTGGGNGPYYLIRPNSTERITIHYLLAILNHPLSEAIVRTNTSPFRGGYYSHGKQFIANLPVPIPSENDLSEIDELVADLIRIKDDAASARTPHQQVTKERETASLQAEIESYISTLFGLSEADMDVIRAVPVPS
jgi:type I restriction-modification system DNA methylase subunit